MGWRVSAFGFKVQALRTSPPQQGSALLLFESQLLLESKKDSATQRIHQGQFGAKQGALTLLATYNSHPGTHDYVQLYDSVLRP